MTLAIIASLFGWTVAVKIYAALKALGIKVENMTQEEFEELLKRPEFRKYFR